MLLNYLNNKSFTLIIQSLIRPNGRAVVTALQFQKLLRHFLKSLSSVFPNLRLWVVGTSGTTAIEFSLMAIPLFTLTLAIIELGLMFSAATMLEGATSKAARLIRTGQVQQAAASPAAQEEMFRDELCRRAVVLIECNEIAVEAIDVGSFSDSGNFAAQYDGDGNLVSSGFDAGGVSSVILIRTAYRYTLMTPLVNMLMGENGTGTRYFTSTIALQTEPYEFDVDG